MRTIIRLLLLVAVSFALSACASQNGNNPTDEGMSLPPRDFRQVGSVSEGASNEDILRNKIAEELVDMKFSALRAVNNFINASWEVWADPTKEILVMIVEKGDFPAYLDDIVLNQKELRKIPLVRSSLVVQESELVPGVQNIFLKIPAEYMKAGETVSIYEWIPNLTLWVKYVDLQANKLDKFTPEEAFLKLFYMGNNDYNPAFMVALEQAGWSWPAMPNPSKFGSGSILIPIGTMSEETKELMK